MGGAVAAPIAMALYAAAVDVASSDSHGDPIVNRRDFARALAAGVALSLPQRARSQAAGGSSTPALCYIDGYHGGSRGHMPAGAWRDVLNALRANPQWKLSFDIEPASWDGLRREDPQAYQEFRRMLQKALDARLEIVNGTFSQPFGWALGGESNIRQLLRGSEILREHFPESVVDVYAVQEPCWSSCLPQILRSLGFTAAVLKNPGTAWGGYTAGFDAEVVEWLGPDGSSIPAVPRYACEDLRQTWETESVTGSAEFARKCVTNGIAHPAGNCYQDLGWAARPKVRGDHIRFVTWREYMATVADKPKQQWRFSQEDILTTLPWGERTLQTLAQQVRSAENRLLIAEKMASLASLLRNALFPADQLRQAWDQLMWAQHHDAWITATTRSGREAWAFQVAYQTLDAEEICGEIIAAAAEALSRGQAQPGGAPLAEQWFRVFNTSATERLEIAQVSWASDPGTRRARVFDSDGRELPCQFLQSRRYTPSSSNRPASQLRNEVGVPLGLPAYSPGESLNAATLLFRARVPATGFSSFRVQPVYDDSPPTAFTGASADRQSDGSTILETDLYRIRIDPARGGAVTSVFQKELQREFLDSSSPHLFNEYRGYFIAEKKWCSSVENPASVTILERGPVRVKAQISGRVGSCRFQSTVALVQGQRRIDFTARFTYPEDTWIGDPWDIKPEDRRTERRRSHHDGRWKLQALFPTSFPQQTIFKNAAFDVCRSRHRDTYFQRWDEIKHNMIVNWVDVFDERQKLGLAVFSDHTTAYTHGPDHPLGLVMGWGWEGGFWWGKCPLRGTQQIGYAVLPHGGAWDEARLSRESCCWNEPLLAQGMDGQPSTGAGQSRSAIRVGGEGYELSALSMDGPRLMFRLFNAEGDAAERTVSMDFRPSRVFLVELDGRRIRQLDVRRSADNRYEIRLAMPRFGIRTISCELPGRSP